MVKSKGTDIKIIFSEPSLKEDFKIAALREGKTISDLGEKILKDWMVKNGYHASKPTKA